MLKSEAKHNSEVHNAAHHAWDQFVEFVQARCSLSAFQNWFSPIEFVDGSNESITLKVPNVFVKEYLLTNFKKDLISFVPVSHTGEPQIVFVIEKQERKPKAPSIIQQVKLQEEAPASDEPESTSFEYQLNENYRFGNFIEGPANQFVKSAAVGVANRPGQSYNPLFIHGGVGLGKTHLLHSIGHHVKEHHKKLKVQCITTEAFINQIVDALRTKSIDKLKRYYRSNIDVLLVDDIQFLQNRTNFEEEFCNTFETLINQKKQIVITSDKPPTQLKLSERIVARMEWGLVAHVGLPDIETRVAILLYKAEQKGLQLSHPVAFHIAEHIHHNIRQLEGALNRISAYSRLMNTPITEDLVERTLRDMFHLVPKEKITVETILKSVAAVFQVRVNDLKRDSRTKDIALPRQVAMFLAKEMIHESLVMIGASFGKTHSTILHAYKTVQEKASNDAALRQQIDLVRKNLAAH